MFGLAPEHDGVRESISHQMGAPIDHSMNQKVHAAAKLAMQDLDPESVRQRYNFMSAGPCGLLAFHLRHLENFNRTYFNTSTFNREEILAFYVTITVNYVTKQSKIVNVRRLSKKQKKEPSKGSVNEPRTTNSSINEPATITHSGMATAISAVKKFKTGSEKPKVGFESSRPQKQKFAKYGGNYESIQSGLAVVGVDSLKNFQVEVGKTRDDEANTITFNLIYEDHHFGDVQKVGEAKYHLFDFLGDMNNSKTIKVLSMEGSSSIVDLEIDFAFRYGLFGYGYGHQVEQKRLDQRYILSQSIFPRVTVPASRRDDDGLCAVMHVDYPEFINLEERSMIGSDPIHTSANKVSEEVMESGEHILKIELNPFASRPVRPGRRDDSDDDTSSVGSEMDTNRYTVSSSEKARFVTKIMNKRQRHPKMVRQYTRKHTRFERIKYLESIMQKRGQVTAGNRDEQCQLQPVKRDDSMLSRDESEMDMADIMLGMAPGINTRSKHAEKPASSSALETFYKVGKKLKTITSLLQMTPTKPKTDEAADSNIPTPQTSGETENGSFGAILEEEEEDAELSHDESAITGVTVEEESEEERYSLMDKAGRLFGWK